MSADTVVAVKGLAGIVAGAQHVEAAVAMMMLLLLLPELVGCDRDVPASRVPLTHLASLHQSQGHLLHSPARNMEQHYCVRHGTEKHTVKCATASLSLHRKLNRVTTACNY